MIMKTVMLYFYYHFKILDSRDCLRLGEGIDKCLGFSGIEVIMYDKTSLCTGIKVS